MREIKFRGKNLYGVIVRQEDGDDFTEIKEGCMWLYGGYAEIDGKGYIFPKAKCHQAHGDYWTDDDAPDIPIVDKETVGEYTGLKDRNGREIYEGDIVECVSWNEYFSKDGKPMEPFRRKMFVDYRKGGFKMVEPMPEPMKDNEWDIICNGDIVVIGNIHDDPQLIDMKRLG